MWLPKKHGSYLGLPFSFHSLFLFLHCQIFSVSAQCITGLEKTCVWTHDPKTNLFWRMIRGEDSYVEATKCTYKVNCGLAIIQSPWLPPQAKKTKATLEYKIHGTTNTWLRFNLQLEDDANPHQIFSTTGNYAVAYPKEWTAASVTIPATHTRYKLYFKAHIPYEDAMIAVKDITLDGTVITTSSTSTTTTTTTTTTTSTTPPIGISASSTTSSTSTSTAKPIEREEEISPTHYIAEIQDYSTNIPELKEECLGGNIDDVDYFPDEEDDERRFQALEVESYFSEEDLEKGFTTVVEPQLCMYK